MQHPTSRTGTNFHPSIALLIILLVAIGTARVHAQIIWNTGSLTFVKSAPGQMDNITQQTALTRNTVLFNAICQTVSGNVGCAYPGPCNTEWAMGTIENWNTYTYTSWLNAQPQPCTPPTMVGVPMVCHLLAENIYLQITFTSWQAGGGNFSYVRTTGPAANLVLEARAFLDGPS
jgi:hypothetical protein